MLYLIGLGLGDERDITVKGLDIVKSCKTVYLEAYTSILGVSAEKLANFYGRPVITADRDLVESDDSEILHAAQTDDVALLVVGDPFGATTHADLILRADELQIAVGIVHNASIMNAIGAVGLALYNFGQTVSIPFFTDTWKPDSWLPRIMENWRLGLHTLCLLDIKVKEQSEDNMARGRKIYEPPRYMTSRQGILQLLSILPAETAEGFAKEDVLAIAVSRLGSPAQTIVSGTLEQLSLMPEGVFGGPLHSFVIIGRRLHPLEKQFVGRYAVEGSTWASVCQRAYPS